MYYCIILGESYNTPPENSDEVLESILNILSLSSFEAMMYAGHDSFYMNHIRKYAKVANVYLIYEDQINTTDFVLGHPYVEIITSVELLDGDLTHPESRTVNHCQKIENVAVLESMKDAAFVLFIGSEQNLNSFKEVAEEYANYIFDEGHDRILPIFNLVFDFDKLVSFIGNKPYLTRNEIEDEVIETIEDQTWFKPIKPVFLSSEEKRAKRKQRRKRN